MNDENENGKFKREIYFGAVERINRGHSSPFERLLDSKISAGDLDKFVSRAAQQIIEESEQLNDRPLGQKMLIMTGYSLGLHLGYIYGALEKDEMEAAVDHFIEEAQGEEPS